MIKALLLPILILTLALNISYADKPKNKDLDNDNDTVTVEPDSDETDNEESIEDEIENDIFEKVVSSDTQKAEVEDDDEINYVFDGEEVFSTDPEPEVDEFENDIFRTRNLDGEDLEKWAIYTLGKKILVASGDMDVLKTSINELSEKVKQIEEETRPLEQHKTRARLIALGSATAFATSYILKKTPLYDPNFGGSVLIKYIPHISLVGVAGGSTYYAISAHQLDKYTTELNNIKDKLELSKSTLYRKTKSWCALHTKLSEKTDEEIPEEIQNICDNLDNDKKIN